jgi:murein DD-endopeptidase MepM/ murein hydrolase activator NlpD
MKLVDRVDVAGAEVPRSEGPSLKAPQSFAGARMSRAKRLFASLVVAVGISGCTGSTTQPTTAVEGIGDAGRAASESGAAGNGKPQIAQSHPNSRPESVSPLDTLSQRLFCHPGLIGPCYRPTSLSQGYLGYQSINPTPDHLHAGVDFAGSWPVYAPVSGSVYTGACGRVTIVDNKAARHVMLHMTNIRVTSGYVQAGTWIGTSSNVSSSDCVATGVHLHYEIRVNYGGVLAVGPTSCGTTPACSTASLTTNPLYYPF